MKIGEIISFTGSTTSSMYFPDEVELENESYPIACTVMQDPVFENGEKYAVQQGAGMVVTKQTEEEEYASVVFLKWFAQAENNIKFGCESGYLPVKKEAVNKETLDRVIQENQLSVTQKTYDSLVASFSTVKDYTMYTNKAFDGGSAARKVLEYHLSDKAAADREAVVKSLEEGNSLEEAVAPYISQEAFEAWLKDFTEALTAAVQEKQ